MQNRVPVAREERAALPAFTPVPRKCNRHDGWTPERQRGFIEALADTGSVTRAAGMVNMAQANCYTLRRAPGAESFRAAWDAALDFGVERLKDIAFERAIDGQLVPRFAGGKLMGFQRKRNDALLMFLLRHYGRDWRREGGMGAVRARATASGDPSTGSGRADVAVEVEVEGRRAHPRRRPSGGESPLPEDREGIGYPALTNFAGVELDAEAHAAIGAALVQCAERRRALNELWAGSPLDYARATDADASPRWIEAPDMDTRAKWAAYHGDFLHPSLSEDRPPDLVPGEWDWEDLEAEAEPPPPAIAEVKRPKRRKPTPAQAAPESPLP